MGKPQVRAFTTSWPGLANVLISEVRIGQPVITNNATVNIDQTNAIKCRAIWDTGATNTVVTTNIVDKCGLMPIKVTRVHTAGGDVESNVYLASIFLTNGIVVPDAQVTEASNLAGADVLIGMDIISHGDFSITNKEGKTTFSFRLPSQTRIDFVKVINAVNTKEKIGRNNKCICGSEHKYKKCCGDI